VFVVDAYTRRILERHELVSPGAEYEKVRELFEKALGPAADALLESGGDGATLAAGPANSSHPPSQMSTAPRGAMAQVFNEMHGLVVGVGKNFCKKSQPECERCPLRKFLPAAK